MPDEVQSAIRQSLNHGVIDVGGNKLKMILSHDENPGDLSSFSGYDSLIVLTPTHQPDEYRFDVYESDGSRSDMCGNGAAAALYFLGKKHITLLTKSNMQVEVHAESGTISVDFPPVVSKKREEASEGVLSSIRSMSQDQILDLIEAR